MNEIKTVSNPYKAAAAAAVVLFFGFYCGFYLKKALWPEAAVFGAVAIAFLLVFYHYGSVVDISENEVCLKFLRHRRKSLRWTEIQEVGVIGDQVFMHHDPKKMKTRYIYFSPRKMSEQERFELAVKKPPKEIIHMIYSEERITFVQSIWNAPLALYNVGDLEL